MLLKFNSREDVAASPRTRNHRSRSYWISNLPEANWWIKINAAGTRLSDSIEWPKDKLNRCRNRAEASRAMSTRVSDS